MSTAGYQKLLTADTSIVLKSRTTTATSFSIDALDSSERGRHLAIATAGCDDDLDRRFYEPTPSLYARIGLLVFVVGMFYVAFMMRAEIWREIIGQEEERVREESEKWTEWVAAQ